MIDSRAFFFSCAILVTLWSSTNADIAGAVRAQYPDYSGEIILDTNKRHPNALCLEALGFSSGGWMNYACDTILCGPYGHNLNKKVPEGSVHVSQSANHYISPQYSICINGRLSPLTDVWNPEYDLVLHD